MKRKEILDNAFESAIKRINPTVVEPSVAMETLKTSMQAYGENAGVDLTDYEIERKIRQGTKKLEKAGKDHSYMTEGDL